MKSCAEERVLTFKSSIFPYLLDDMNITAIRDGSSPHIFGGEALHHIALFLLPFCDTYLPFSCLFALFLRHFAPNGVTLHCIESKSIVFFCYLDRIYINILNICDLFIYKINFASPLVCPQVRAFFGK